MGIVNVLNGQEFSAEDMQAAAAARQRSIQNSDAALRNADGFRRGLSARLAEFQGGGSNDIPYSTDGLICLLHGIYDKEWGSTVKGRTTQWIDISGHGNDMTLYGKWADYGIVNLPGVNTYVAKGAKIDGAKCIELVMLRWNAPANYTFSFSTGHNVSDSSYKNYIGVYNNQIAGDVFAKQVSNMLGLWFITLNIDDSLDIYDREQTSESTISFGMSSYGNAAYAGGSELNSDFSMICCVRVYDHILDAATKAKNHAIDVQTFGSVDRYAIVGGLEDLISMPSFLRNKYIGGIQDCPSCTSIPQNGFRECPNLKSIGNMPSVSSIEGYAFYGSSIESIGNLDSCTAIGTEAFSYSHISSIGNLNALMTLGAAAFQCCTSLIHFPDIPNCTSIGANAFAGDTALTTLGNVSSVQSIGGYAFLRCRQLTTIGELASCTSIGSQAFRDASNINEISLPAFVDATGNGFENSNLNGTKILLVNTTSIASGFFNYSGFSNVKIHFGTTMQVVRDGMGSSFPWGASTSTTFYCSDGHICYENGSWTNHATA